MQIGNLVRPVSPKKLELLMTPIVEHDWIGVIIDFEVGEPVVYWNEEFNAEVEYCELLEVINASR